VLVDLFLGQDRDGRSCVYVTLLAERFAHQYVVPHPIEGMLETADPTDPDAHLIADPLAPMIARLRYELLAPAGQRPVNRVGATALVDTSASVLGDISGHLADLRSSGRNHLVFWPHGPLAFVPFHLLPVDQGLVADEWTATTIVALDALVPRPVESDRPAEIPLGLVASPDGGVPFELPSEPRLWDQAVELERVIPKATLLPRGEASPAAATALFPQCRRVHIGAHGATLGQVPSYHCLFLDQPEDGDGRLFAHDILRTDLRAVDLVTLCACESALGRVDPAGNIRGLPTAFMAAGVRAVIATLWPVTAESAVQFFGALHTELGEGRAPLDAFRTAQVLTRAAYPRYADWGAFTYIGAWW
jgi:CHAT domain-containing protein